MNSKKAKALRKRARQLTPHLDDATYTGLKTRQLGECTRGAYKALKRQRFKDKRESATIA